MKRTEQTTVVFFLLFIRCCAWIGFRSSRTTCVFHVGKVLGCQKMM